MRRRDETKRECAGCWQCGNEFLDYDRVERVVRCAVCGQRLPLWMLIDRLLAEGDERWIMNRKKCPCAPLMLMMREACEMVEKKEAEK